MTTKTYTCAVDAGNIIFANWDRLQKMLSPIRHDFPSSHFIELPAGTVEVTLSIDDTYDGAIERIWRVTNEAPTTYYVGDACYISASHKVWTAFLNRTGYLMGMADSLGQHFNTGGDGQFEVTITWQDIANTVPAEPVVVPDPEPAVEPVVEPPTSIEIIDNMPVPEEADDALQTRLKAAVEKLDTALGITETEEEE